MRFVKNKDLTPCTALPEHVDHEILYDICQTHIPELRDIIQRMIKEVSEMEGSNER